MIKNKKIIAIIPARGGSKGLLKKNIKSLAGKPLIAYTIEKALESKLLNKVIVSTDSKEIADISKKYGAEVPFLRPKRLAEDNSPTIDVILHTVNWFEKKGEYFDIVVLLEPTSPLRKKSDIDKAVKFFIKNIKIADSLVSLGEVHLENPYITKKVEKGYVKPLIKTAKKIYQRQLAPKAYFPYGVIYLSKIDMLKKFKTFYQKRTLPYFIERWQAYEIDDIYDFLCVEKIINSDLKKKQDVLSYKNKKKILTIQGKNICLKEFSKVNLYDKRYYEWLRDLDVVKTIGRPEYLRPIQFLK